MSKPSLSDFIRQFSGLPDNQEMMSRLIAALAPMTQREFCVHMGNIWEDVSEQTAKAVTAAIIRNPEKKREIEMLLRFSYRTHAIAELFKLTANSDMQLEPDAVEIRKLCEYLLNRAESYKRGEDDDE